MQLKKFICLVIAPILTTPGCAFNNDLYVQFNDPQDSLYLVRKTKKLENCSDNIENHSQYIWWGFNCNFKSSNIPDKMTITYSKWMTQEESKKRFYGKSTFDPDKEPMYTYYDLDNNVVAKETWLQEGNKREFAAIDKLPPSAWHTYTIDTKAIMKKYQGKLPPGLPNGSILPGLPALFPPAQPSEVVISIYIDPKTGAISTKDTYRWQTPTTTRIN